MIEEIIIRIEPFKKGFKLQVKELNKAFLIYYKETKKISFESKLFYIGKK